MAFDGFVTHGIVSELKGALLGGKIDKIYQPEKDEITLSVRTREGVFRVLLSASTAHPRVHFTEQPRENPKTAPLFCMILRKHLTGGKIKNISQVEFDRIIQFDIECYTEMGDLTEKSLIIEIMGKHSNIVFVQKDKKIIDSIKHIDFTTSAIRQVLPGLIYELPPVQDKFNPLDLTEEQLCEKLKSAPKDSVLDKLLLSSVMGLSPLLAREIVFSATGSTDTVLEKVDISGFSAYALNFIRHILANDAGGCVAFDLSENKPLAFSKAHLSQYDGICHLKHFDSLSLTVEAFFLTRDIHARLSQKAASTIKLINNNLERCNKKIALHTENIKKSEDREKYKIFGDLLTSNLYRIESGTASVTLENYYSASSEQVEISLKPELSPAKNAQRYYKLYNKAKAAEEHSSKQLKEAEDEKSYLESVLDAVGRVSAYTDILDIRDELFEQGYISAPKAKSKQKVLKSKPLEFLSSDGYTILVGRNNKQNDELTIKSAYSTDLWLHTKNIPGSHVIVRTNGQGEVPDQTLVEAAEIAAYHSKAQNASGVAVDYTLIKNIRKPNGAKPGFVIYDTNYTVFVTPDKQKIESLKKEN
ncbi:MAG: NFACT family protein [Clostridia bacterium]|nr:NFACT family protein [Clostridia bacterium]